MMKIKESHKYLTKPLNTHKYMWKPSKKTIKFKTYKNNKPKKPRKFYIDKKLDPEFFKKLRVANPPLKNNSQKTRWMELK